MMARALSDGGRRGIVPGHRRVSPRRLGRERDPAPLAPAGRGAALVGRKELLLVPGAGHNDTLAASETWQRIETWLERLHGVPRYDRAAP